MTVFGQKTNGKYRMYVKINDKEIEIHADTKEDLKETIIDLLEVIE